MVPPKTSTLIGISIIINHPFWVPLFLETPILVYKDPVLIYLLVVCAIYFDLQVNFGRLGGTHLSSHHFRCHVIDRTHLLSRMWNTWITGVKIGEALEFSCGPLLELRELSYVNFWNFGWSFPMILRYHQRNGRIMVVICVHLLRIWGIPY